MGARGYLARAEPSYSLPVLERLAPPPPPDLVAARIERSTAPGDVVVDLNARGGWIARSAIDRQRRAISIESGPLTRLLAELVLRPPDVRHLDAAFQALAASPRGETSLRLAIGDMFATRCPTCERALIIDDVIWQAAAEDASAAPEALPVAVRKHFRCTVCRDQQGGGEQRQAPLDDDDHARAGAAVLSSAARRSLHDRFPAPEGAETLTDQLLSLHTNRQLAAMAAILERIESDLRAEPIEAALRLAFLHAVLPSSRLASYPGGRFAALRISSGQVRLAGAGQWRERNPWLAFEDGMRLVRGFVQRLDSGSLGPLQARFGDDIRSLAEGPASVVLRVAGPAALRALDAEARDVARLSVRPRVRLILAQPPPRPTQERVALSFFATAWALGRDAAASLPLEALAGPSFRAPWGWQSTALRHSLAAVEPLLERDGRAVLLLEAGGPEALVASVLGGVGAGFRLLGARLAEPDEDHGGIVELLPPGATLPPPARTRANVSLAPLPGGAGDPEVALGRGLFAAPERFDARPFSAIDAGRTVTETAVDVLKARGEPARTERLLGEILVGLDRAGQLRRLVDGDATREPPDSQGGSGGTEDGAAGEAGAAGSAAGAGQAGAAGERTPQPPPGPGSVPHQADAPPGTAVRHVRGRGLLAPSADQVERLVALIRDELSRAGGRRLVEIEPGRWWLADRADRAAAAPPLADRVEWAVYSLLSTGGPMSEASFFERIAALFTGHDLPDETLVRGCLDSYRSRASTADRMVTGEDLLRRSHEHGELLAELADGGHRLGMQVWIGLREQARRVGNRRLGDWLDEREQTVHLPLIARAPIDELEAVDCIWYVRGKAALMFEVEWTAMLGEPILRRHARIPQEDNLVRFLAIPPERTELVRHKLERSPLLRAAIKAGNWHVVKWNQLRAFLANDPLDLSAFEPYLGLDPLIERSGDQLPLFGSER